MLYWEVLIRTKRRSTFARSWRRDHLWGDRQRDVVNGPPPHFFAIPMAEYLEFIELTGYTGDPA
jgi:hypothetical protein